MGKHYVSLSSQLFANYQNNNQQTLTFGEDTVSRLSDEDKHALTSQFAFVNIDEATLPKKAGFVLKQEGIEYNYLFEALIEDLKEEYSPILARKHSIG